MSRSPFAQLAVAAGLLLASLPFAVSYFLDPRPFSEVADGGIHLTLYSLTLAGMLALLVAIPRLTVLVSPEGRRLPPRMLAATLLATALNAATHFVQVFVAPFLADVAPAALDAQGGLLMVGMVASWIAFMLAWAALSAVAIQRRVLSWTCGVLLIVGAVVLPAVGPLASLPLGAGLALAARTARRPVQPVSARVLVEA